MISVHGLRKVFPTTDGGEKVAVEDLNLRMQRDKITGLLGKPQDHFPLDESESRNCPPQTRLRAKSKHQRLYFVAED